MNGRVFEAVVARVEKRSASDLYHSALVVAVPEAEFVIEQAPVRDRNGALRGVVAEGAIGTCWLRSLRVFRYENRRWLNGVIPDVDEAVESPQRLTDDPVLARRVLELVPRAPTPVWGRDELRSGEMWNSNSLISWLLVRAGVDVELVHPPLRGRAPGWRAGLVVANRHAGSRVPRRHPRETRITSIVDWCCSRRADRAELAQNVPEPASGLSVDEAPSRKTSRYDSEATLELEKRLALRCRKRALPPCAAYMNCTNVRDHMRSIWLSAGSARGTCHTPRFCGAQARATIRGN